MKSIVGTYSLIEHGIFNSEGKFKATSDYMNGELYYGADGTLHVLILFKMEPKVTEDIFGYTGKYKIKSDTIVEHHFTVATVPRQVGAIEERTYKVEGDDLILGRKFPNGDRFKAVWRRK